MGFRSSKARSEARREWLSFIASNASTIAAARLPEEITGSIACWDEFLLRGFVEIGSSPTTFDADQLSEPQYGALTRLVDSYFAIGYEYFTPGALRNEDQQVLNARYGPTED